MVLNGVTTPPNLRQIRIPGATLQIREGLKSPSTDEFIVGATKRLGSKGLIRGDLVLREWEDFYSSRNRPGDSEAGSDVEEVGNFGDDVLSREYTGILLSARYRLTSLAANTQLSGAPSVGSMGGSMVQ